MKRSKDRFFLAKGPAGTIAFVKASSVSDATRKATVYFGRKRKESVKDFLIDNGVDPEYAKEYRAVEISEAEYNKAKRKSSKDPDSFFQFTRGYMTDNDVPYIDNKYFSDKPAIKAIDA